MPRLYDQKAYDRARYLANRETVIARATARNKAVPRRPDPKATQRAREWYQANKGRAATRQAQYRATEAGRLVHRSSNARRRAKGRGALGHATTEQIAARIAFFGGLCSYCRKRPYEHLDHAIPLSRGGSHWPSNIRPACQDCNLRKWTQTWREFLCPA